MKKSVRTTLRVLLIFVVVAAVFALVFFVCKNKAPEEYDFSDRYTQMPQPAEYVAIYDQPNVRSEPIVCDDKGSGTTNSYGAKKIKTTFMLKVSEVVKEYEGSGHFTNYDPLDYANGSFFGLHVEDITSIDGWEEVFPKDIVKDPDGIIWINHNYISVSWIQNND